MTFRAAGFGIVARDHLRLLPGCNHRDREIWQAGVESGRLQIWAVIAGEKRVGTVVWNVETEADGRAVIVVQALFSRPVAGVDMFAQVEAAFAHLARLTGVSELRFWTVRPGLKRKAERAGYTARYVMERAV